VPAAQSPARRLGAPLSPNLLWIAPFPPQAVSVGWSISLFEVESSKWSFEVPCFAAWFESKYLFLPKYVEVHLYMEALCVKTVLTRPFRLQPGFLSCVYKTPGSDCGKEKASLL
jgi:hypothetical protein